MRWPCAVFAFCQFATASAVAQTPQIAPNGIANAASGSSPIAPGGMIAIYGTNLAASEKAATGPLPIQLNGTSVAINGSPAPLAFVSPGQINAQVPAALVTSSSDVVAASVVVTTTAGSSSPVVAGLASASPGFFTRDASGCGQAAALNVSPDGTLSVNSPSNSAAPGDTIALFGTGFGLATQQPADGFAATGPLGFSILPSVSIDGSPVAAVQYAGLAPSLPGVDQINVQIPASTRNGCAVPISASQTFASPTVTISVQKGRGSCTDPPTESYGQFTFYQSSYSGAGSPISPTSSFVGSFPSGPNVQPPAPSPIVYAPSYITNVSPGTVVLRSPTLINFRTCAVPGYTSLSAGSIQIQPPSGAFMTAEPQPLSTGGVYYSQTLPAGFVVSGAYTISGSPAAPVDLQAKFVVGSPIQLQTTFPAGTVVSSSQPLTVKWTGGDAGTLVKVILISDSRSAYTYADAASGSITISPFCTGHPVSGGGNGVVCSFGLPRSQNALIIVQGMPAPERVTTINVPGITGPVQLSWLYSYNFSGLSLGN